MKVFTNIDGKINDISSALYQDKDKWEISRVFNEIKMA